MRKKRRRGGRQEGRIEEGYGEGQLTLKKPLGNLLLLTDPSYGPLGQFKVLDMSSIFFIANLKYSFFPPSQTFVMLQQWADSARMAVIVACRIHN